VVTGGDPASLLPATAKRSADREIDNKVAGYAVFFTSYSTWLGRNGIYMEDLYVTPEFRGRGAGKALANHRSAGGKECGRLEWSVLDWNQPAIDFYLSIGAVAQSEWVRYRLDGAALAALLNGAGTPNNRPPGGPFPGPPFQPLPICPRRIKLKQKIINP
jgi:ribosomal protein S18 acetylase RimI-like enzyme